MAAGRTEVEPDFEPRHRIAGAAILIGFAVLVFSLVLDENGPRQELPQDVLAASELPLPTEYVSSEEETKTFVSKITPIGGATPKAPAESKTEPAPPARKRAEPVSLATAASRPSSNSADPEPAAVQGQGQSSPDAGLAGDTTLERGWMVRVGTFTDKSNVERVMKDLKDKGFTPSSTPTRTASGTATRVWLGPYAQRVEAARVRSRLEQGTGEPGLITAYP